MFNVATPAYADDLEFGTWSAAEVLDAPLPDHHLLRAVICRLSPHQWQWSLTSIEGEDSGALISTGIESNAEGARRRATAELTKCLENPLA